MTHPGVATFVNDISSLHIATALVVAWCIYVVVNSATARLSQIPGPILAQYTDLWNAYKVWQWNSGYIDRNGFYKTLQERYGDCVRVGPRTVLVFDPAAVPVIYGVRAKLEKVSWSPAYFASSGNAQLMFERRAPHISHSDKAA